MATKKTCRVAWFSHKTGKRIKAMTAKKRLGMKRYAEVRSYACRHPKAAVTASAKPGAIVAMKEGKVRLTRIK